MGNVARRWLALGLVAVATVVAAYVTRGLPGTVTIDLRGLLPFSLEPTADAAPRWVAVAALPALATVIWILFTVLRSRASLALTRRLFGNVPETLGDPASVDRFHSTYDTIVLWLVVLVLGIHAGVIAAALGHLALAPRIISVVIGVSLIAIGNVVPRLRPNLVAGIRTRGTLADGVLWRATHRIMGITFVLAGLVTVVVGLVAPSFGLSTAVITLIIACVVAAVGGTRVAVTSRA